MQPDAREAANAKYRLKWAANEGGIKERKRAWRRRNRELLRKCYAKARAKYPERAAQWEEKMRSSPLHRIRRAARRRITGALKRVGAVRAADFEALLGCSYTELTAKMEAACAAKYVFTEFGRAWHMDHIREVAGFDLTKPEEQHAAFHWSNIQPLSVAENKRKSIYERIAAAGYHAAFNRTPGKGVAA